MAARLTNSRHFLTMIACIITLSIVGCGGGSAGIASLIGSSSSSKVVIVTAEVQLVEICSTQASPAILAMRIIDEESRPATIRIRFRDPNTDELKDATLLEGNLENCAGAAIIVNKNLTDLASAPDPGLIHYKAWDYEADLGSGEFRDSIVIDVVVVAPDGTIVPSSPDPVTSTITIGNTTPELLDVSLPVALQSEDELSDLIPLNITVLDLGSDAVNLKLWVQRINDLGDDDGARIALHTDGTQGGAPAAITVPDFEPSPTGSSVGIIWASKEDLAGLNTRVQIIVEAIESNDDDPLEAVSIRSAIFRVDNNEAPQAIIAEGPLFINPDQSGIIPIPVMVQDPEFDRVQILLQFASSPTGFPALPTTAEELLGLNAAQRRALQIASEVAQRFGGLVQRALPFITGLENTTQLRLPELSQEHSLLEANELLGKELLLTRVASEFRPANAAVPAGTVDILGSPDPCKVVVLAGSSQSSLQSVDLNSGATSMEGALFGGSPLGMCFANESNQEVLIATSENEEEIAIFSHTIGSVDAPQLRGVFGLDGPFKSIAQERSGNILIATQFSLSRATLDLGASSIPVRLVGLQNACDLVLDPNSAQHALIAERDFFGGLSGRIARVNLVNYTVETYGQAAVNTSQPQQLALSEDKQILLTLGEGFSGGFGSLREHSISGELGYQTNELNTRDLQGSILEILPEDVISICTGAEGLQCFVYTNMLGQDEFFVRGGVEQKRTITDYDSLSQTVTVDPAFSPLPQPGTAWLIVDRQESFSSSPAGKRQNVMWNSADLGAGGEAFIRAIAIDNSGDFQVLPTTSIGRAVDSSFEAERLKLNNLFDAIDALPRDLNQDGRMDLLTYDKGGIQVFAAGNNGIDPNDQASLFIDGFPPFSVMPNPLGAFNNFVASNNYSGGISVYQLSGSSFVSFSNSFFSEGNTLIPAFADLNLDGFPELVIASESEIAIYEGLPEQILGTGRGQAFFDSEPALVLEQALPGGTLADFKIADLNGDGQLDLIHTAIDIDAAVVTDRITTFLMTTDDGDIVAAITDSISFMDADSAGPYQTEIADINNDGRADILAAIPGGLNQRGHIAIFFQNSNGQFIQADQFFSMGQNVPSSDVTLGGGAWLDSFAALEIADLNQDGWLDVIAADFFNDFGISAEVADSENQSVVFYSKGFPAEGESLGGNINHRFSRNPIEDSFGLVHAADFDSDGQLDLLSLGLDVEDNATVQIIKQKHQSLFASAPEDLVGIDPASLTIVPLVALDTNGDGLLDLTSSGNGGGLGSLRSLQQEANGAFGEGADVTLNGQNPAFAMLSADLNGDGRADLIEGGEGVSIYYQSAAGFVTDSSSNSSADLQLASTSYSDIDCLAVADLDGNNLLDIIVGTPNLLGVYYQDSLGVFGAYVEGNFEVGQATTIYTAPQSHSTANIVAIATGDMNGDTLQDVVICEQMNNQVPVLLQEDRESFNASFPLGGGFSQGKFVAISSPTDLKIADINKDRKLDVVVSNAGSNTSGFDSGHIAVFTQFDSSSFSSYTIGSSHSRTAIRVELVDVDQNGQLDIVCASFNGEDDKGGSQTNGNIAVYLQRLDSFFSFAPNITLPALIPTALVAEDLDGDGSIDLAAPSAIDGTVRVYFGGR